MQGTRQTKGSTPDRIGRKPWKRSFVGLAFAIFGESVHRRRVPVSQDSCVIIITCFRGPPKDALGAPQSAFAKANSGGVIQPICKTNLDGGISVSAFSRLFAILFKLAVNSSNILKGPAAEKV
jgi:hypothetical protein